MKKYILLALLTSFIICQYPEGMAGGYMRHKIGKRSKDNALKLIKDSSQGQNGDYKTFLKKNKELIHYSTQVVAGLNYGLIYQVKGSGKKYACFKIYQGLDRRVSVTYYGEGDTTQEAANSCSIPGNF